MNHNTALKERSLALTDKFTDLWCSKKGPLSLEDLDQLEAMALEIWGCLQKIDLSEEPDKERQRAMLSLQDFMKDFFGKCQAHWPR